MPNVFESDLLPGLQERAGAASASGIAEAEFVPPEEPIPQPEPVPYEPPATGTAGAEFVPPGQPIPQGIPGGYGVADGDSVSGGGYGVADGESATGTATASREVGDLRPGGAQGVDEGRQAGVAGDTLADAYASGSVGLEEPPERPQAQAGAYPMPPSLRPPPTAGSAGSGVAQATAGAASERETNRQRITELEAMPETQDTSTPEWRELRDLVRDERVRAFQDASFENFAEAVYRQLLDKDPEGATRAQAQRIAQARIDAAGGDVQAAAKTHQGTIEAEQGTTAASVFLEALVALGLGAPIRGAGIVANLLGRGSLTLPRYVAMTFGGELGARAGADVAPSVGLPPWAGGVLGGLGGGVAGAVAPSPAQVGH